MNEEEEEIKYLENKLEDEEELINEIKGPQVSAEEIAAGISMRDIEDAILDLLTRDEGMSIFILKLIFN